jgi:hypothetical protein
MLEVQYQLQRPFVLDSAAATATFGIEPTSTDEALRETIECAHQPQAGGAADQGCVNGRAAT